MNIVFLGTGNFVLDPERGMSCAAVGEEGRWFLLQELVARDFLEIEAG